MDAQSFSRAVPLKDRRLHKPYMYKTVFEGGRVFRSPSSGSAAITLRYFRAEQDLSRIGFIIRKKTGKACMRNSIRRTLRRSFQEALPRFCEGAWLVFDVSDKAAAMRRGDLRGEADRLLGLVAAANGMSPEKEKRP